MRGYLLAAGVTERLWEMADIVDVLDAFEAKRKGEPKVILDVAHWRIGDGAVKCNVAGLGRRYTWRPQPLGIGSPGRVSRERPLSRRCFPDRPERLPWERASKVGHRVPMLFGR